MTNKTKVSEICTEANTINMYKFFDAKNKY